MSRNTGNRSAAPRKSGSPLLTGILVGMVIGVAMAAGLAWFIMKSPSPFLQTEQAAKLPVAAEKPAVASVQPSVTAASGVTDGKPRFEFYKVLTDKQDSTAVPPRPAVKSPPKDSKPAAAGEPYFLQAGSFPDADDADKLKARLALLGIEASTQAAFISPDKGVWHRVRVGPYKNADEMNRMRILLKQNGVDATPMRAQ